MSDPRDSPIAYSATALELTPRPRRALFVWTAVILVANVAVAVPAYVSSFPAPAPDRIDLSGLPTEMASILLSSASFALSLSSTITGPAPTRVVGTIGLAVLVAQVAAANYGFTHLP